MLKESLNFYFQPPIYSVLFFLLRYYSLCALLSELYTVLIYVHLVFRCGWEEPMRYIQISHTQISLPEWRWDLIQTINTKILSSNFCVLFWTLLKALV